MTNDVASLDRLHDLVLPPDISWWPPAPGWYVVLGIAVGAAVFFVHRAWWRWRADAYRRAALRELEDATHAAGVAELLRRTALAIMPRAAVARMAGSAWVEWLACQSDEPMPVEVRDLLTAGIYRRPAEDDGVAGLREYAARWIAHHRPVEPAVERTE